MAWGGFLDKLISKLPIQGRVERWKNEINKLEKEREKLLNEDSTFANIARMRVINVRIDELHNLLRTKAQD